MESNVTFIGLGEAGCAFAVCGARGYDRKLDDPAVSVAKLADFRDAGVTACDSAAAALTGAEVVLSLVTADQALAAAQTAAPHLMPDALWLDMNSVAPDTKRAAAAALVDRARYVDVAVMAPVRPAAKTVPLLIAGPHAEAGATALAGLGFGDVSVIAGGTGAAAAVKMIRSVMVKGIEALTAECALAADAAGVLGPVLASLEANWPGAGWARRFDYNFDRMMVHGTRRAAELDEVAVTLDALGVGSAMSRAAAARQRAIGALETDPPMGLTAKLAAVNGGPERRAA